MLRVWFIRESEHASQRVFVPFDTNQLHTRANNHQNTQTVLQSSAEDGQHWERHTLCWLLPLLNTSTNQKRGFHHLWRAASARCSCLQRQEKESSFHSKQKVHVKSPSPCESYSNVPFRQTSPAHPMPTGHAALPGTLPSGARASSSSERPGACLCLQDQRGPVLYDNSHPRDLGGRLKRSRWPSTSDLQLDPKPHPRQAAAATQRHHQELPQTLFSMKISSSRSPRSSRAVWEIWRSDWRCWIRPQDWAEEWCCWELSSNLSVSYYHCDATHME